MDQPAVLGMLSRVLVTFPHLGAQGGADRWWFCADASTQLDQPRRSPVFSKHTSEDRLEVIADLAGPELTGAVLPNLLAYESAPGCSGVDWRS